MRDHFFDTVDMAAQRDGNRTPLTRVDVCEDGETVNVTTTAQDGTEVTIALSAADARSLSRTLAILAEGI